MAQRTIAHMYDRYEDAEKVVTDLEGSGVPHDNISLVANADSRGQTAASSTTPGETHAANAGGAGALLGTAVGGGLGLLAGIGALAIPGVGPVVAAGWLVATLTGAGIGAAGGGLVGSLTGAGFSQEQADVYAQHVHGGGSLVSVRVDDTDAAKVESVMAKYGAVDWQQRRSSYGSDWTGFDENRKPLPGTAAADPTIPASGADGAYAPGTDPGRRL